jgi:pilus assembly protein Flp/PilA
LHILASAELNNERGATAIEYTLIVSLIAVASIVAMRTVGGMISNVLSNVATAIT